MGCLAATHFYKWPNLHSVTILNLHHSQGALNFATLFSPLLKFTRTEHKVKFVKYAFSKKLCSIFSCGFSECKKINYTNLNIFFSNFSSLNWCRKFWKKNVESFKRNKTWSKQDRSKTVFKTMVQDCFPSKKTLFKKGKSSTFDEIVKLVLRILKASTKEWDNVCIDRVPYFH